MDVSSIETSADLPARWRLTRLFQVFIYITVEICPSKMGKPPFSRLPVVYIGREKCAQIKPQFRYKPYRPDSISCG